MQPKNYQCELAHNFVVHNFVDYKMTVYQMNYLKALDAGIHTGFQSSDILEEYRLGSKSNITRIESVLLGKELIDKRPDGVYFADPVFAFWFHREYCK